MGTSGVVYEKPVFRILGGFALVGLCEGWTASKVTNIIPAF